LIWFGFHAQAVTDLLLLGAQRPGACERLCRELVDHRRNPRWVAQEEPSGSGLRRCVLLRVDAGSAYGIPLDARVVLEPIPHAETRVLGAGLQPRALSVGNAELLAAQRRWSLRPPLLAAPPILLAPLAGARTVLRRVGVAMELKGAGDRAARQALNADSTFEWRTVRVGDGGGDRGGEGALDLLLCLIFRHVLIVSVASSQEPMARELLARQVWRAHQRWLAELARLLVPSRGAEIVGAPPVPE
jgi:hypothetical protein